MKHPAPSDLQFSLDLLPSSIKLHFRLQIHSNSLVNCQSMLDEGHLKLYKVKGLNSNSRMTGNNINQTTRQKTSNAAAAPVRPPRLDPSVLSGPNINSLNPGAGFLSIPTAWFICEECVVELSTV